MAKLKTNKSISKRFKVSGNRKLQIRHGGQGHFNSRQTGNQITRKRRDKTVSPSEVKALKKLMPYC
ncbi:MAG: 50S ribosomal protein L35 [Patescibacteria group bacterium]